MGSTAPVARATNRVGSVSATRHLSIEVWLTPDVAGATRFDEAVSTPGDPLYQRYLTPDQYTADYGPSVIEAKSVSSWLRSEGFTRVKVGAQRASVTATGSVAVVDRTFSVHMGHYRVPAARRDSATVVANDRDLSLPSSLRGDVMAVTGLNSAPATTFHETTGPRTSGVASTTAEDCSHYWGQYSTMLAPPFAGVDKAPLAVCGYSAHQLRAAYGLTNADTGAGQTIALIELGTPNEMFQTLVDYAKANKLPPPRSTQFREEVIGRGNACGNPFDTEEQIDAEAVYAMAPRADQLMVDGDSCNGKLSGIQPLFDAVETVLDGDGRFPEASIVSNSWGIPGGEKWPPVYAKVPHAIDLRASAEGVGMYYATGDNPGVSVPASDPFSSAVGGTTLGIGRRDDRMFETGWSDHEGVVKHHKWVDSGVVSAGGGGTSILYKQPSYQAGIVPPSMATYRGRLDRTVPDIAADADPYSGLRVGKIVGKSKRYVTQVAGGTSLACPLVAGMVADAQQGRPPFGFINPLIYSLAGTGAFHDVLPATAATPPVDRATFAPRRISGRGAPSLAIFDSEIPADTSQVSAPGYDTMTGVGTPDGSAFVEGLRRAARGG